MAKGPYGNPLSTGIALNWKVDMTPWREEQKLQRAEEAARKAAQEKIKKEQADLMKGITFDPNKVLERDRDQALSLYASTISDAMKLSSQGNVGGTQMRILQFNRDMAPLLDGKANYDAYDKSDAANTFKDEQMLRDFNDLSMSREELLDKYPDISLQNGAWQLPIYDRIDVDAIANKLLQNTEKRTVRDEKGNPIIAGRNLLTGEIEYQEVINDPEGFMNNFTSALLEYGPSAQKQVMNYFKGTDLAFGPDQFDELDEDGTQTLAKRTNQYLNEKIGRKLIGFRTKAIPKVDKEEKDWSYSNEGAKSKDYSIRYTDRPVDLSKEIGGELMGYDVNYIGTKQNEPMRTIRVSQGSYFAEGGDKFLKVSDSQSGEGVNIKAQPGGIYMRKDKPSSEGVWLRYVTPYAPASMGVEQEGVTMEELKYGQTDEDWAKMNAAIDLYVPAKSLSEASDFLSAMNLPPEEYNRLVSDLTKRFGEMTPTQSTTTVQSR
jgi:hypothetical protein